VSLPGQFLCGCMMLVFCILSMSHIPVNELLDHQVMYVRTINLFKIGLVFE
jgi:hypothetical protein